MDLKLGHSLEEYKKRLSRYCKLTEIEVPDEKTPDNASETEERQIKEKEGDRLLVADEESIETSGDVALIVCA